MLAGILASLIGQKIELHKAMKISTFIHGKLGAKNRKSNR